MTSDQIHRQTTKPVGGSRLSDRLVPEIYGGFQGCRADVYQARCKFRSALSQIYDLCFSLSSRPLSPSPPLPWEPQVLTMRVVEWFHTGWGFQPGVLNAHGFGGAGNNAVCALPSEYFFSPSPNSSSPLFSPLFSHLLSAVVPTASSLQSRDIACAFIIFGNSVSDKIMSCVTFITFLSIVLKGNLLQIFT